MPPDSGGPGMAYCTCHNACATSQRGRVDGLGPQKSCRELVTRTSIAPASPPCLNLGIPTPQRGPRTSRTGLAPRPLAEGASGAQTFLEPGCSMAWILFARWGSRSDRPGRRARAFRPRRRIGPVARVGPMEPVGGRPLYFGGLAQILSVRGHPARSRLRSTRG